MFEKIGYDKVQVTYGDRILGTLDWGNDDIITALQNCFSFLKEEGTNPPLNLIFEDADNKHLFGIVQIGWDYYTYRTLDFANSDTYIPELILVPTSTWDDYDFVYNLSQEMILDIETAWDDYVAFIAGNTDKSDVYYIDVENTLRLLVDDIKSYKKPHSMEIGNMLFGNSRGKYLVNRDWQDEFHQFLEDCGFNSYGQIIDENLERTCGQIKESIYSNEDIYPIGSKPAIENPDYHPHIHYFDNGTFMLNPYYWGDAEDLMELPNFIYYPDNYELSWYKYPLRDSWSNQELTFKEFCNILDKCKESLN